MIGLNPQEFSLLNESVRRRLAGNALAELKEWLKVADLDVPEPVVDFRAETVEITKQSRPLGLSPETLLDLQEIARRCERWIAAAIRRGQRQGRIRGPGVRTLAASPESVAKQRLSSSMSVYYAMFDNLSDEQFEFLIAIGRDQGTLAQLPLMQAVRDLSGYVPSGLARQRRRIAELAESNYTSRQISHAMKIRVDLVNRIARGAGIEISADLGAIKKSHRIDPERIIRETVIALEGLAIGLGMVHSDDYDNLNSDDVVDWIASLGKSFPTIATLRKELNRVDDQDG